jgi:hypothetical protein
VLFRSVKTITNNTDRTISGTFAAASKVTVTTSVKGSSGGTGGSLEYSIGTGGFAPLTDTQIAVPNGSAFRIRATSETGYMVSWTGAGTTAGNIRTVTVASDVTVSVEFVETYTVTVTSHTGGGTFQYSIGGGAWSDVVNDKVTKVPHGSSLRIEAVCDPDQMFIWDNGTTATIRTIASVTSDTAVGGEFRTYVKLTIAGTVTKITNTVSDSGGRFEYTVEYTFSGTSRILGPFTLPGTGGSVSVPYGSTVVITAIPDDGYLFTWSDGTGGTRTVSKISAATSIGADFTQRTYSVMVISSTRGGTGGTGGSFEYSIEGGAMTQLTGTTITVPHGATVVIRPRPLPEYVFKWDDGAIGTDMTVSNVTTDGIMVGGTFLPAHTVSVTRIVSGGGTGGSFEYTIDGGPVQYLVLTGNVGMIKVPEGSVLRVLGIPETGYGFAWTVLAGATIADGTMTFTVHGDTPISGTFTLNVYTVTVTGGTGGAFEYRIDPAGPDAPFTHLGPGGTINVPHGSTVEIRGIPSTGYGFAWTAQTGTVINGAGMTIANVTANVSVSGTFTLNVYTVTVAGGTGGMFKYRIDPVDSGDPFFDLGPGGISVPHGSTVEIIGVPGTGYNFAWIAQTGTIINGAGMTIANVTANVSVSGTFTLKVYTVTLSGDVNGSFRYRVYNSGDTPGDFVTVTGSFTVNHGQTVEIIGVPGTGYNFAWTAQTGAVINGVNMTIANVTADMSVSGTFTLKVYTVTISGDVNGSFRYRVYNSGDTPGDFVTVTGSFTVTHGQIVEIIGAPNNRYSFTWDDHAVHRDVDGVMKFTAEDDAALSGTFKALPDDDKGIGIVAIIAVAVAALALIGTAAYFLLVRRR